MALKGITFDGTALGLKDEEARQSVSTLGTTVSALGADIGSIETAVGDLSTDVQTMGSTISTFESRIDNAADTAAELVDDFANFVNHNAGTLHKSDFENGTWAYANKASNSKRLRNANRGFISGGTTIFFKTPSWKIYFGLLEANDAVSYTYQTGWLEASSTERSVTIPYDGYLNIILETADGTSADLDNYDCNIAIEMTGNKSEEKELTSILKAALVQFARSVPYLPGVDGKSVYASLFDALYSVKYNWDFTTSLIDSIEHYEATPGTGGQVDSSPPARDSSGLHFTEPYQYLDLGPVYYGRNQTIEIDVTEFNIDPNVVATSRNVRFVMNGDLPTTGEGILIWRKTSTTAYSGWSMYELALWSDTAYGDLTERNVFANSTVRLTLDQNAYVDLYINGVHQGRSSRPAVTSLQHLYIGSSSSTSAALYPVTITGIRIYGEVIR